MKHVRFVLGVAVIIVICLVIGGYFTTAQPKEHNEITMLVSLKGTLSEDEGVLRLLEIIADYQKEVERLQFQLDKCEEIE